MRNHLAAALAAALIATAGRPVSAQPLDIPQPDGSHIVVEGDGLGMRVDASGRILHAVSVVRPIKRQ